MCLVILFGGFLPGPEAARLQQAPMRGGVQDPPAEGEVKGAEIRQSQPQIVPVVLHEGGRSLVPCLSPPNLPQVGASRAELPEMGVTRWDRWELPSQTRKLGVGPL